MNDSREPSGGQPVARPVAGGFLGAIRLAPGYLPRHAVAYLYAAFITIGVFAFAGFFQTYLLHEFVGVPESLQARTLSMLNVGNELVALALVAPFGALADKVGRRAVYAFGFLWLASGFLLYPLARTTPQLAGCALFFSVGVAAMSTMLGTVLADTPAEGSRGRFVGLAGFCQGLGAAALIYFLGRAPKWLHDAGFTQIEAGSITLWMAAGLCALSAVIVMLGLRRGTPSDSAPALPLRRILAVGMGAARGNRRIWFAYLLQFGSFGDRVVLGSFLTLRLQQGWLERGEGMADAMALSRQPYAAAMVGGLVAALVVGMMLDRVDRLRIGVASMALAGAAYLLCGFTGDPAQGGLITAVAVLLGTGQIAALIAAQTVLGQEAPRDVRGAVFGLAMVCGSAAILFTNGLGGWLYDSVSKGGPFFLLAAVNFAIFGFGMRLVSRSRE